jgi:glycosyltransferase involved in cell wall biosynthesis
MWISVVIASLNRRDCLHDTVLSLARQSRPADEILLSVVDPERDLKTETLRVKGVRVVAGPLGLTIQRNTGIANVHEDCDLISFLDDDVELHPSYLRSGCEFMEQHPEIVAISDGGMIANGTPTGELSRSEAIRLVESSREDSCGNFRLRSGLYGCDMMVRRSAAAQILFDTRLLYYALYEDLDFGARCARLGFLAAFTGCKIVHLATRTSKFSDRRNGYAHVMNGFYIWRKGSQNLLTYLSTTIKGLIANICGMIVIRRGISRAQRRERLWGNILGFRDIMIHGAQPELIENI